MKSIVVYNPISGHGHLDSWSAIFTKVLLESGWTVLAITPDPEGLIATLNANNCLYLRRLKAISLNADDLQDKIDINSTKALIKRLWRKINARGYAYIFNDSNLVSLKPKALHEKLLASSYLLLHFCRYFLFHYFKTRIKAQDIDETPCIFTLSKIEKEIEVQKFEADFVFHMYLDGLKIQKSRPDETLPTLKFKWAGIRFSPEPGDSLYFSGCKNIRGIALLDQEVVNDMARSLPNVLVRYLPDIANLEVSKVMTNVTDLIKYKANGRKIVFLGGIIGKRKNLSLWLDLIDRANSKDWYFVQIGEIDFQNLDSSEFLAVYKKLIFPPENLTLVPSYISDESIFNGIISISDIVFAVYKNFRNSSNMITKASFFHKPILVSNQYLMGKRVETYGIGLAVPEDKLQKIILGLEKLASENIPSANFKSYNNTFNQKVFCVKFLNFIDELNETKTIH
jgi:hypothetical protein